MELRARAKRDRTRFHELKSVRKSGHSRAVPGERQVSMSGKTEGTGGGHRAKEASQVTIIGSLEVESGQLSRKNTPSPG